MVAALLVAATWPAEAATVLPAVKNPDFGSVGPSGVPTGWSVWNPVGIGASTVVPTAGPTGGPAVRISSTTSSTVRYALTQRVPVDDSTPRKLEVSAQVKGEGISGGLSEIRVQVYDASNHVLVPVQRGPYLTGSFDWKRYSREFELPPGSASISIEPMLDQATGSLWVTDVALAEQSDSTELSAAATSSGSVELSWSFPDTVKADRYAVYRTEGSVAPSHDSAHIVVRAYASTVADDSIEPGATYTYQVDALDSAGRALATTTVRTVTAPASFVTDQRNTVLTALWTGSTAHVAWRLPPSISADDLVLTAGGIEHSVNGSQGSIEVAAAEPGQTVTLKQAGVVLASSTVGNSAHPRSVLTPGALTRIRASLAQHDPTATAAWDRILARIAGPDSGYTTNGSAGFYRARDAAFVYAITGDQAYAQIAHDGVMAAESFVRLRPTNTGLELGRAALLLAPAYDWSYRGWSEQQRQDVRNVMGRAADYFSTYHHPALDDTSKTSNWVGVARTTELAMLLAARGDGDFGLRDKRIGYLADQVAQHLDQAYTDTGYTQEGWDYLHYTLLYLLPSAYFADGTGMQTLDAHLARPDFANLMTHVGSFRAKGDVAQFGVSGPNGQVDGTYSLLTPLADQAETKRLTALYDATQGIDSTSQNFDGVHALWTVLYHPTTQHGTIPADRAGARAILDDKPGFYAFRNRFHDMNDTLVVTSNRNTQHRGWAAAETFSLSWMGEDTTWALLGGKQSTDPSQWSKPLVDGHLEPYADEYSTVRGAGRTLASRSFAGQGGGFVHLDGSRNFGVVKAEREEVVDLSHGHATDALIAIKDTFGDDVSHRWDWQLRPEAGVNIAIDASPAEGEPMFTFTSPNGAVLSGFVRDPRGLSVQNLDGTLRLSRQGTAATFEVLLATSRDGALTARQLNDGRTAIDGRLVDWSALESTPASGLPPAPRARP